MRNNPFINELKPLYYIIGTALSVLSITHREKKKHDAIFFSKQPSDLFKL